VDRRTLLTRVVAGFSAVAAIGFTIPFIRSWVPAFSNEVILDVDLEDLKVGQTKTVRWLGRNVFIVRRDAQITPNIQGMQLNDEDSVRSHQPVFAANAHRSRKPEHLVVFTNCTHLGCEVALKMDDGFQGFSCPCHRSQFDDAGRVERGAAAKSNLEVPDYDYIARSVIRLKKV
jgi:ubiquinol-cytochrome c reductase iron-sulfur subunit